MTRGRYATVGLCAVLLAGAGVLVMRPSLLEAAPIAAVLKRWLEAAARTPRRSLLLLGFFLVALSLATAGSRSERPTASEVTQQVRGVVSETAGSDLEDRLDRLRSMSSTETGVRQRLDRELRAGVRATAVAVLMRVHGWTEAQAHAAIAEERWTDDPQAGALLSGTDPPWSVRLREWLSIRPATEQRVERAVVELETMLTAAGLNDDDPDATDSDSTEPAASAGGSVASAQSVTTRHPVETDGSDESAREGTVRGRTRVAEEVLEAARREPSELLEPRNFGLSAGFFAVAVGLLAGTAVPFLLGVVGIGYTLSKYVTDAPVPAVELTREIGTNRPMPGDLVDVRVTVENVGERTITDLRVIDGPPDALGVVEGSPSLHTSLQPGGTDSITYTLRSKRGEFAFDETRVITRSLSSVRQRTTKVDIETRIACTTLLEDLPLQDRTGQRIGTVETNEAGSGIEFYATREYREGDPLNRIDWNRLAKTTELTTVQFREQRATTVTLVLDEREAARVAPTPAELDGVDLGVYAAERAFLTLLEAGNRVGLITYGDELDASGDGLIDIAPGGGTAHRARVQSRLRAATDRYAAALGEETVGTDSTFKYRWRADIETLGRHVPRNAQVLLVSPATDDFVIEAAERLRAAGRAVTVLSPAVVGASSVGERLHRLDRECRLQAIRDTGARVIDWQPDEAIQTAVARATSHWQ